MSKTGKKEEPDSTVFYNKDAAVENVRFKDPQEKRAAVGQSGAPETKTRLFNVRKFVEHFLTDVN